MFAVFDRGADIRDIQPNFDEIKNLDGQGLIISSTDDKFDWFCVTGMAVGLVCHRVGIMDTC